LKFRGKDDCLFFWLLPLAVDIVISTSLMQ